MNVVDIHPEDLLDKDARGELSTDERGRLDAHLARCSACRAERMLRLDFADELDGEDRPSALIDLVQGALAAPRVTATPGETESEHAPEEPELVVAGLARKRRPRRTAFVLLVAAAVLAASAAGATGMTSRVWSRLRGGTLETTHASATSSPTATTGGAPTALHGAPAALTTTAPVDTAIPEESALPAPAPLPLVVEPAVFPAPARAPLAVVNTPPPAVAIVPASAIVPAPAAVPTTAAGLFESANAARRSGDAATALARYDALDAQFPASREARVAKATTGRLLLDRGDSSAALARFDAYLASGSPELREEAMAGRATALERLGRADDEARAWSALLATYPGTPYGAHARARIARSLPR